MSAFPIGAVPTAAQLWNQLPVYVPTKAVGSCHPVGVPVEFLTADLGQALAQDITGIYFI